MSNSGDPDETLFYAWREISGELDLDSISDTQDGVRIKGLKSSMGWRFDHPERYDHDEEWTSLLKFGNVVPVMVSVLTYATDG